MGGAAYEEESVLRPGDLVEDKYRVEQVLGRGGMGVVLAATHLDLREVVALKILRPHAATQPETVERFFREARALRKLQSAHAVRVLDVGRLPSRLPYMTMELLEGEDLKAVLRAQGPLPVSAACDHIIQACEALAEAHSLGIVHRDIKPSNLFLSRGRIKVIDFGIAKVADPAMHSGTETSAMMGSASYMSPEQMRSTKRVDGRADVWSLGVTLFELLTGRLPFESGSLPELILAVYVDPPPAPRSLRPEIPEALEQLILRCLTKEPAQRPSSAGELAMALVPFASASSLPVAEAAFARPAPASEIAPLSSPPAMADETGTDFPISETALAPRAPHNPAVPTLTAPPIAPEPPSTPRPPASTPRPPASAPRPPVSAPAPPSRPADEPARVTQPSAPDGASPTASFASTQSPVSSSLHQTSATPAQPWRRPAILVPGALALTAAMGWLALRGDRDPAASAPALTAEKIAPPSAPEATTARTAATAATLPAAPSAPGAASAVSAGASTTASASQPTRGGAASKGKAPAATAGAAPRAAPTAGLGTSVD